MGRWFEKSGKRDEVVLATKFQARMGEGPNDRGASAFHIRAACDASLKRLQTDRIDIYQMHHINRDTPWDEVFQAMEVLVQQGKVLYFGSSNFAGWQIAAASEAAKARRFLGVVSEQSRYSLLCRYPELEVLPACRHYGLGVIPWSPLESGLLGGVLEKNSGGRRNEANAQKRIEELRPQLEKWEAFCRELKEKPADVGTGVVAGEPGSDGADHWSADAGAVDGIVAGARD